MLKLTSSFQYCTVCSGTPDGLHEKHEELKAKALQSVSDTFREKAEIAPRFHLQAHLTRLADDIQVYTERPTNYAHNPFADGIYGGQGPDSH